MGFLGLGKKSGEVRGNAIIGITPLGEKKATEFQLKGDMFRVVGAIHERGASSIMEISDEIKKNPVRTQQLVATAIARGYLRVEKVEA